MKWLSEKDITAFLKNKDYDIRKSHNARWIDQKCAADVVTIVADCILNFIEENGNDRFSSVDIWHDAYTVENVENIFKKPNPDEKNARSEYDKFFQQPMEMFAYAGILNKHKVGSRNFYTVASKEILSFIALREKNALVFLINYIETVLIDSGLFYAFEEFFKFQNKVTYSNMKEAFKDFTVTNTPINGETECFRIFIKVLNPLAYRRNAQGTEKGKLSKHKITYDMLMYNRDNFRDVYINKPKDMTRAQYVQQMSISRQSSYTAYLAQKAKKVLRVFNDNYRSGRTEVYDERHIKDSATNMHHIFPQAAYPEISSYLENLIALTPTQHFNYAHPNGNTQVIDEAFQHICLIAKAGNIKENLEDGSVEAIYDFKNFMFVLYVGLEREIFNNIEQLNFDSALREINLCYT